jgi:glycosyltransferase involved in cell wall biosynthesis
MRVAVDFRVMGGEAATRGMGRFTQQQVFEALQADPTLEVFPILHDPLLPERCVHDWMTMPRVHPVWTERDEVDGAAASGRCRERKLYYAQRLQSLLLQLGVDLFCDTTPFLDEPYSALTRTPVAATCYDLIPLIFPRDYFGDPGHRATYYAQLRNLRAATRVGAISQSAARDLRFYTGYPAPRIDITYPFIESSFRPGPIDDAAREAARHALRERQAELPERFMLSVTGIHRSKNVGLLLDAFAAARRRAGWTGLPLVIVLPSHWTVPVFRARFGTPEDVVLLSEVPDADLRDLYITAEFVFQPSMYEGFGYPVAEAMSCGAAVIATRTASIPEITGEAALLLDPTDHAAGAEAILRLAGDAAARDALRALAQPQAMHFRDPRRLGESTLKFGRDAATPASARPRIALWSSMPPLDCGIADYTAELADALAETHEVDVYTDGSYTPTQRAAPNVHFRHPGDFDPKQPGLVDSVFQMQARDYQYFMYRPLLRHGGTVLLHDLAIGNAIYWLARHHGDRDAFEDEMLAAEGPDAVRALGTALVRTGGKPDFAALVPVFERHPGLRWAVGPRNRVLTHTDSLAQETLRHYPDARVRVVCQGYGDRVPTARQLPLATWRHRLGVGPRGLIVGVFGIVGPNKRVEQAIAGFEPLWRERSDSLLVIIGNSYDADYIAALRAQIAVSPARDRIILGDYAPPDMFHAMMALTDVLVTLRWPALGGMSAILMRGLAAGKPVIISDIPDWRGTGDAATLPVPVGEGEAEAIGAHLLRLAADPAERIRLARAARAWYHREATLRAMVDGHLTGGRPPAAHNGAAT